MKYFYIITFDNQIFEITYTEEKMKSAITAWKNADLLLLKEVGGGIHASSISKILNEELYDSYTHSSKPKTFIKDGIWYDGQERKLIRYEKWKQEELDAKKQKMLEGKIQKEMTPEETKAMFEKYMPDFIREKRKSLINNTKI